jgi:hypothetical protein|tara:strand:+ start:1616 stop:1795 length:180 start_codon:yes stop_codon:yes gene_type:complete
MHKPRIVGRTLGEQVPRKRIPIKGTGAATKGTKYYAYADQTVDKAKGPPAEWVSTIKKV